MSSGERPVTRTPKASHPKPNEDGHLDEHEQGAHHDEGQQEVAPPHRRREHALDELLRAHLDDEVADAPHAARHERQARPGPGRGSRCSARPGSVTRSSVTARDVGAAVGALEAVVDEQARHARLGAGLVVAVGARRSGHTTSDDLAGAQIARAAASTSTIDVDLRPRERRRACVRPSGPATTATRTGSGGLLRKAMPRATARMTGKPKVQKSALGSRKKRRKRASVSSTSAERSRGRAAQSRRPLPVSETNTSSSVAWRVERRSSARPRGAHVVDERRQRDVERIGREREARRPTRRTPRTPGSCATAASSSVPRREPTAR